MRDESMMEKDRDIRVGPRGNLYGASAAQAPMGNQVAYNNPPLTPNGPPSGRPILQELQTQQQMLEVLIRSLRELEERLTPVLAPHGPEPASEGGRTASRGTTPIANALENGNAMIAGSINGVRSLMNRLEV